MSEISGFNLCGIRARPRRGLGVAFFKLDAKMLYEYTYMVWLALMQKETHRYGESLRRFAEQWTDSQIREAIADEERILRDQSLSDVARDNSKLIHEIYLEVLNERDSNSAA